MSISDIVKDSAIAATQAMAIQNNIDMVIPETEFFKSIKSQWMRAGFSESDAIKMAAEQEAELLQAKSELWK